MRAKIAVFSVNTHTGHAKTPVLSTACCGAKNKGFGVGPEFKSWLCQSPASFFALLMFVRLQLFRWNNLFWHLVEHPMRDWTHSRLTLLSSLLKESHPWLEWNSSREREDRIIGCWVSGVLLLRDPHKLDWKVPVLKRDAFVFPPFPSCGWLCWSNDTALFSRHGGPRSGSDGRLPTSHQTFSQSFSSTGQPRGPLEPPQIIKPWSLSCLRPAPPLRPSAALGYKEVIFATYGIKCFWQAHFLAHYKEFCGNVLEFMLWHTRQSLGNCQTRGFLIYQLSTGCVCTAWVPGSPPRVPLVHLSRGPARIPKGHFTGLEFPPKQTQFCIWDHSGLLSQTGKVLQDQDLGLNYEGPDF